MYKLELFSLGMSNKVTKSKKNAARNRISSKLLANKPIEYKVES